MSVPSASRPASPPHLETLAVAAGRPARTPDAPLNEAMTPASTYVGVVDVGGGERGYGRYGNPGWSACEAAIGALEGGRALLFSSGMAAVQAVLDLMPPDGVLVIPDACYLGVAAAADQRAARGGLTVRRVDVGDTDAVLTAAEGADLVWLESPTNPLMQVADLATVGRALRGRVRSVVDNTFATPLRQQPLDLGFDLVVHAVTKFLAGHSDVLLGAVVGRDDDPALVAISQTRALGGAVPGTLEAYLALRGMRTLAVRLDRAEANARVLADRLAGHPAIRRVRYPGFGSLLSVDLADARSADAFVVATEICVHSTSLGGVETMLERRRRWPKELEVVPVGLVRISVGIEHVEDLWADLHQALDGTLNPDSPAQ